MYNYRVKSVNGKFSYHFTSEEELPQETCYILPIENGRRAVLWVKDKRGFYVKKLASNGNKLRG